MDQEQQDVQTPKQLYPNQKYPVDGQVFKILIESSLTWLRTNQADRQCFKCFSCTRW